jgi:NADH-quinone oxidoreductase subunit L
MLLSETTAPGGLFSLVPLIILLPLAGMLINMFFGSRFSEKLIGTIASSAAGLAFVVSVLLAVALSAHPEGVTVTLAEWIKIGELQLDWAFRVDTLSVTMMLVVSGVGTLIHIYAIGYMHEDVRIQGDVGRYQRFFVFMNLFIVAMMLLVSGANYMMLFIGWEGVGLSSYLLIGFWYDKGKDGIGNAMAAKKAFVTNRIGDFGFLIAAFLMFWAFGTFDFEQVFSRVEEIKAIYPGVLFAIGMFMLLGVTGKSAQIPLYVWLPDAMAGPTPVSALIHAATMVTAGVYLVARSAPLYNAAPEAQWWVTTIGGVTALFAATMAVGQFDIKKVLAYSTISQLGFMVAAVGSGAYVAGIFHLVTHAFFKALLFLSSGSVILGVEHGLHHVEHDPHLRKSLHGGPHHFDPQDMRNMGGLWQRMPRTRWVYLIGALALAGIVPFAGFWSKDEVLFYALKQGFPHVFWLLIIAAFFTAFYMTRQIWMVFFGQPRTAPAEHAHDNPPVILVPLIILAALSVVGGALNLPYIHTFEHWLDHTFLPGGHEAEAAAEAVTEVVEIAGTQFEGVLGFTWGGLDPVLAIGTTLMALVAIGIGYVLYGKRYQFMQKLPIARRPDDPLQSIIGPLFKVFENKYWIDELYWSVILTPYTKFSHWLAEVVDWRFWHDFFHDTIIAGGFGLLTRLLAVRVDLGIVDGIANGLASVTQQVAAAMRKIQTGRVRNYAWTMVLGVVVILGYLLYINMTVLASVP